MTDLQQLREIIEAFCHEWDGFTDENYYTEGASNYWSGKEVNRLFDLFTSTIEAEVAKGRIDELKMHQSHETGEAGNIFMSGSQVDGRIARLQATQQQKGSKS
jgi:hypothetical protein